MAYIVPPVSVDTAMSTSRRASSRNTLVSIVAASWVPIPSTLEVHRA